MHTLIKINHQTYLVKSAADAARIVNALAGAIKLDNDYARPASYWPDPDDQTEVSMIGVHANQLLHRKPRKASEEAEDIITPSPAAMKRLSAPAPEPF